MKGLFFAFLVLIFLDPNDIGKSNEAKAKAKEAFVNGDYEAAIKNYQYLTDSLGVKEEEVMMNLAHAYFNANDTANAIAAYHKLLTSKNNQLKSNAYQQLGVINNRQEKLEEALANFKEALRANPANEDARYDYEMVKKKIEEKKKQEQNQQNKDQQNQDQDKKDQKDQKENQDNKEKNKEEQEKKDQQKKDQEEKEKSEQEKKEEQEQKEQEQKEQKDKKDNFNPDKMKEMKVSEEKAKMILEAMKNQEVQYLQQNKRKATKPKDKSKPDW